MGEVALRYFKLLAEAKLIEWTVNAWTKTMVNLVIRHSSLSKGPESMNEVDLHTHTTASDGTHTPQQLVSRAAKLAVKVLAITDHDSTAGVAEAQAAGAKVGR